MAVILVVEDDKNLNNGISFTLKKEGYIVISSFGIADAKSKFNNNIDLILLDIGLPDGSGLDFCKEIRGKSNVKIVFFTANDTEKDMVKGFLYGCDDYIAKPFSLKILKHKINAILKRNELIEDNTFEYLGLKIDYDKMTVSVDNRDIALTATEYKLLELLAINKNQVLTKNILLEKLWDSNGKFVDESTLSVNIQRLRKKIEKDPKSPKYIITVFGIGYTLGDVCQIK